MMVNIVIIPLPQNLYQVQSLEQFIAYYWTGVKFQMLELNSSYSLFHFRPVKGICGFSRETVVAITTNIESMEYRRRESLNIGHEEHPRAGSTDDVEAFFALLHRFLGNIFTLKEFKTVWRKVVR